MAFLVIQSGKQVDRGDVPWLHKKTAHDDPPFGHTYAANLNRVVLSCQQPHGGHGANAARRSSERRFNSVESPRLRFAGFSRTDNRSADVSPSDQSRFGRGRRVLDGNEAPPSLRASRLAPLAQSSVCQSRPSTQNSNRDRFGCGNFALVCIVPKRDKGITFGVIGLGILIQEAIATTAPRIGHKRRPPDDASLATSGPGP
jgi:hypothetical protein